MTMNINFTFDDLMVYRADNTELANMLIQALAIITTSEEHDDKTPWEVFEFVKRQVEEVSCVEYEE